MGWRAADAKIRHEHPSSGTPMSHTESNENATSGVRFPPPFLYVVMFICGMGIPLVNGLIIRKEERYLLERFGDVYQEYLTGVRRWI